MALLAEVLPSERLYRKRHPRQNLTRAPQGRLLEVPPQVGHDRTGDPAIDNQVERALPPTYGIHMLLRHLKVAFKARVSSLSLDNLRSLPGPGCACGAALQNSCWRE